MFVMFSSETSESFLMMLTMILMILKIYMMIMMMDDGDDCDYCDYCYDQCLVIVIIVMFKADRSIRKASHLLPVALSPLSRLRAAASDVLQRNINKNKKKYTSR